jgi:hypothetical protein
MVKVKPRDLTELFQAWDQMDATSKAVQTAQAHQMTEAAQRLEIARERMRAAVNALAR